MLFRSFGTGVVIACAANILSGATPHAATMGVVGVLAFAANVGVAIMLYRFRDGDANMRSVWLCTRNDAVGNFAVVVAAFGVLGTATFWPDIAVASVMAGLALSASASTIRAAMLELSAGREARVQS